MKRCPPLTCPRSVAPPSSHPLSTAWHNSDMKLLKRYSNIAFCAALLAVALSVAVLTFPHVNHATAVMLPTLTEPAAAMLPNTQAPAKVILAHGPTFPPNSWCDGDQNCSQICNLNCPPNMSGECPSSCKARLLTQFRVATAGHAMAPGCKMACCRKKHKDG